MRILVALAVAYLLLKVGYRMIGGLARPIPEPPPEGELRKVNLRYRCPSCGAELKMTKAANEDPVPPRHCMDEMELLPPRYE